MTVEFVSGVVPPASWAGAAWWFVVRGGTVLVRGAEAEGDAAVPLADDLAALGIAPVYPPQYLGAADGVPCFSVEAMADAEPPAGMAFAPLRGLFGRLPDWAWAVAGKAVQIAAWERTHQFCGQCGSPTERVPGERATRCPQDGLMSFPRLSPAVIVRINRGPELLLARGSRFPAAFYSVLAGFVEPGESLEETVVREVREEVGIQITDVRYFGSQPWPFPNSVMIGFTASYAGGALQIDESEIADAQWFRLDDLPRIPPPPSIARRLIDAFLAEQNTNASSG